MKYFKVVNLGKGGRFRATSLDLQLMPTELHMIEDGAKNGGPSFVIVLSDNNPLLSPMVYGQISMAMLNEALNELGYDIVKKPV